MSALAASRVLLYLAARPAGRSGVEHAPVAPRGDPLERDPRALRAPLERAALAVHREVDGLDDLPRGDVARHREPEPPAPRVARRDYRIALGGRLCAYRFDGEPVLEARRFVSVGG